MQYWLSGIALVLLLIAGGLPIAFAMMLVGFGGTAILLGLGPAFSMLGQVGYETGMSYTLTVVPLFLLMGNLIVQSKLADELYAAGNAFIGHLRGGLAMATVAACGGFASVCGSSMATSATMAKVAMPSMRHYGYPDRLAAGAIASGGTLGILIPPSIILVLYGIITQQDIGKLFIAGILPGVVGILGYMIAVQLDYYLYRDRNKAFAKPPWRERLGAIRGVVGVLVLFLIVMGGIYVGIFTAVEAGGIGATGALVIALLRRSMTWKKFYELLYDTCRTSAMMFIILIGALALSQFVNLAGMPEDLEALIENFHLSPMGVIFLILLIYVILGAVMESLSMMLLTVPIFFPIVQGLGFDPIWFGIIIVMVIEIALISPPVGMNVFVLNAVLPEVSLKTIFKGIIPFLFMDVLRLLLFVLVPGLVLWLPSHM